MAGMTQRDSMDMPDSSPQKTPKMLARLELVVNEDNKVMIFHDRPFRKKLAWLEYELKVGKLNFVFDDGEMQELGVQVPMNMDKLMHNAHQVLVIEMEAGTREPSKGIFYPVILQQAY